MSYVQLCLGWSGASLSFSAAKRACASLAIQVWLCHHWLALALYTGPCHERWFRFQADAATAIPSYLTMQHRPKYDSRVRIQVLDSRASQASHRITTSQHRPDSRASHQATTSTHHNTDQTLHMQGALHHQAMSVSQCSLLFCLPGIYI